MNKLFNILVISIIVSVLAACSDSTPELFVATISKARRTGKILIDYLRNRKKATAIIPWSVRARPGSPIAAPVSWTTLSKLKSARAFDVINIPPIDPWTSFWTTDQAISHVVITMLKRSMDGTR